MFDDLAKLLDDSGSNSKTSILISSYDFDSNFLLQHFVSYSIKNAVPCLYLSLLTPFSHLKHVQMKFGQTLKTADINPSSPLMFVPLFSTYSERFVKNQEMLTINELWNIVASQLIASPKLIIIEDLQIFRQVMKYSDQEILFFIRNLYRLYPDATIITQVSIDEDESSEHDDLSSVFIYHLKRIHEKHLFVRNLATGATKDISGQIVYSGPSSSSLWTDRIIRKCLFNLTDRTLNLLKSAI